MLVMVIGMLPAQVAALTLEDDTMDITEVTEAALEETTAPESTVTVPVTTPKTIPEETTTTIPESEPYLEETVVPEETAADVPESEVPETMTAETYVPGRDAMKLSMELTTPAGAQMNRILINESKTSEALLAALDGALMGENLLEESAAAAELTLQVADSSTLVPGKSYKLALDIEPVGHASDTKITTITVTIKIAQ